MGIKLPVCLTSRKFPVRYQEDGVIALPPSSHLVSFFLQIKADKDKLKSNNYWTPSNFLQSRLVYELIANFRKNSAINQTTKVSSTGWQQKIRTPLGNKYNQDWETQKFCYTLDWNGQR